MMIGAVAAIMRKFPAMDALSNYQVYINLATCSHVSFTRVAMVSLKRTKLNGIYSSLLLGIYCVFHVYMLIKFVTFHSSYTMQLLNYLLTEIFIWYELIIEF